MNPRSLENLQPFKPGQSGNPAGRPKRRPITEEYAALAETPIPENLRKKLKLPKGTTSARALALGMFDLAIKGDVRAGKEIREAIEGKAEKPIAEENKPLDEMLEESDDKIILPSHLQARERALECARELGLDPAKLCPACGAKVLCDHKRCQHCDGCHECSKHPDPNELPRSPDPK